jgi:Glycosyltransferase 61
VSTSRVERVYALREWVGRRMPTRWTRRYGYFYVWRRVLVERMLRAARAGAAPEFATITVADAVARTPGARVVELEPATSAPFPLPRVHTTRRWLLDANRPSATIARPAMRVLNLPNGVVFTHEGAVGPDPGTIVTDLGFVYPITERELFRRADAARQRGREHLPGTTVSMLQLYPSNHAHNLMQGISRLDLFRRAIAVDAVDRVLMNVSAPPVMREAIARVGFGPDRVVEVPDDTPTLVCERLLAAPCMPQSTGMPEWALEFLREVFGVAGPDRPDGPRRIFVVRGKSDARGVVNQAEVAALLEARGFATVSMDDRALDEQAAMFAAADVVVAVHGAALANLVFARPGTHAVELVGANTLNWVYAPLSWAAGLEHDVVVGVEPTPLRPFWTWQRDADQIVDVDRLVRLVDRIDARAETGAA